MGKRYGNVLPTLWVGMTVYNRNNYDLSVFLRHIGIPRESTLNVFRVTFMFMELKPVCLSLLLSPAHLKSKKHHYHVRKRRKCEPEPEPASHQPQGTTPPPTSTTDGPTLGNSTTLAPGSAEACGEPESPGTSSTEKEAPVL